MHPSPLEKLVEKEKFYKMVYADHNATTPLDRRVLDAMLEFLDCANPSSIHKAGQLVRRAIENARTKVARFIGVEPKEVIFTSGATESCNMAIKGVALSKGKGHIVTSAIEHRAVLETVEWLAKNGFSVTYIKPSPSGVIDPEDVKKAIRKNTILISIMHVNNETGTIQPIKDIAEIAREHEILFHTDATQSIGKIRVNVREIGADLLSFSGHKFYGPKGIGVLCIKRGVELEPLIHGGHHEMRKRAGTENVAAIVGLAKACEIADEVMEEDERRIGKLRDKLEKEILGRIPAVKVIGKDVDRIYNTSCALIEHVDGNAVILGLSAEGILASSGSACNSDEIEPSHVLLALGISPPLAHSSVRFSFGRGNKDDDVEKVLEVLQRVVKKLREISPFWNAYRK